MQPQLSSADRTMRVFSGLVSLSCAAGKRQSAICKTFLTAFGAIKVAEGVIGWCPLQAATQRMSHQQSGAREKATQAANSPTHTEKSGNNDFYRKSE